MIHDLLFTPTATNSQNYCSVVSNFNAQSVKYLYFRSSCNFNQHKRWQRNFFVSSALPESAAAVLVASLAVGAAATLLARKSKDSQTAATSSLKVCEECSGSGLCSECNGEGFVFKKLRDGSAEKARMAAKNMATRYTAGLPTKWTYCSKCSSARSCRACGGSGRIS